MPTTLKTTQSEQYAFVPNRIGWAIVRFLVAAVLLVASVLKAYQSSVLENNLFKTRCFQFLLVEGELAIAVILLLGLIPKISWLITTILFTIFSIVSLSEGLKGSESCHCFGAIQMSPFLTFALDIGILVLCNISV
jgi:hypothetical protein